MSAVIPERVLVSLQDRESGFQSDAELPSHMPASKLSVGLLRLLQSHEPGRYSGCTKLDIWIGDRKLSNDQTLASVGAWDGTVLAIRPHKTAF